MSFWATSTVVVRRRHRDGAPGQVNSRKQTARPRGHHDRPRHYIDKSMQDHGLRPASSGTPRAGRHGKKPPFPPPQPGPWQGGCGRRTSLFINGWMPGQSPIRTAVLTLDRSNHILCDEPRHCADRSAGRQANEALRVSGFNCCCRRGAKPRYGRIGGGRRSPARAACPVT